MLRVPTIQTTTQWADQINQNETYFSTKVISSYFYLLLFSFSVKNVVLASAMTHRSWWNVPFISLRQSWSSLIQFRARSPLIARCTCLWKSWAPVPQPLPIKPPTLPPGQTLLIYLFTSNYERFPFWGQWIFYLFLLSLSFSLKAGTKLHFHTAMNSHCNINMNRSLIIWLLTVNR